MFSSSASGGSRRYSTRVTELHNAASPPSTMRRCTVVVGGGRRPNRDSLPLIAEGREAAMIRRMTIATANNDKGADILNNHGGDILNDLSTDLSSPIYFQSSSDIFSTKYFQMRLPTEKFVTGGSVADSTKSAVVGNANGDMSRRSTKGNLDGISDSEPSLRDKWINIIKQLGIHGILAVCVILYIISGALVFQHLETKERTQTGVKELLDQIRMDLSRDDNVSETVEQSLRAILMSIRRENGGELDLSKSFNVTADDKGMYTWDSFAASVLFAFTAVSTVGYGQIYPVTEMGRMFCILYTICGIPLFMIGVADVGKFVWEVFRYTLRGRLKSDSVGELSLAVSVPLIITVFIVYIFIGALLIPQWEERLSFVPAIYFCFISVTTVGFGDIIPENRAFLPITLTYIFFGLALTTLAIEVLAAALRRFHYLGKPIQNAKRATVWIGGKVMSVDLLLRSMAREFGATEEQITQLNAQLDEVLEVAHAEVAATGTVAMNEPQVLTDPLMRAQSARNGDLRKFSGSYDNIPESWTKVNKYVDDGEAYYLLNVPLDNI